MDNISDAIINSITNLMDNPVITQKRNLTENTDITTTPELIKALKTGKINGTSIIEWNDDVGSLQVNVMDFLLEDTLKVIDPLNGKQLRVKSSSIKDGDWRLMY